MAPAWFGGMVGGVSNVSSRATAEQTNQTEDQTAEETPVASKDVLRDVKLTSVDAKQKIKVIKEVRTLLELGLKESKDLVEGVPQTLKTKVSNELAEEIKKTFEALGCAVEIV